MLGPQEYSTASGSKWCISNYELFAIIEHIKGRNMKVFGRNALVFLKLCRVGLEGEAAISCVCVLIGSENLQESSRERFLLSRD